jgi:hypothetical protein
MAASTAGSNLSELVNNNVRPPPMFELFNQLCTSQQTGFLPQNTILLVLHKRQSSYAALRLNLQPILPALPDIYAWKSRTETRTRSHTLEHFSETNSIRSHGVVWRHMINPTQLLKWYLTFEIMQHKPLNTIINANLHIYIMIRKGKKIVEPDLSPLYLGTLLSQSARLTR